MSLFIFKYNEILLRYWWTFNSYPKIVIFLPWQAMLFEPSCMIFLPTPSLSSSTHPASSITSDWVSVHIPHFLTMTHHFCFLFYSTWFYIVFSKPMAAKCRCNEKWKSRDSVSKAICNLFYLMMDQSEHWRIWRY